MTHREQLAALRGEIDSADRELLAAFTRRMDVSEQIGKIKAAGNIALTDEGREQQVMENALAMTPERHHAEAAAFTRSLMAISKIKQRNTVMPRGSIDFPESVPLAVSNAAFFGVTGSFTEMGAAQLFPKANLQSMEYCEDVFAHVRDGQADVGVVPIENSKTGAIGEVYDLLRTFGCYIVGQTWVSVEQCLLARPGAGLTDIREVMSHPQGFEQCRRFLKDKSWDLTTCRNTAVAAQTVAEQGDNRRAAIGSRRAAEAYGLNVLAPGIMDDENNRTRFIAIAKNPCYDDTCDTVGVSFATLNVSGALCSVLQSFWLSGLNMTRLESRPVSPDRYRFFCDLQTNISETRALLEEAAAQCEYFEILGCYKS